jgi:hypothetical protein
VKIKQAGSHLIRLENLLFKTAQVIDGFFRRIRADTSWRRPIQAIAFLSFRVVHHSGDADAFHSPLQPRSTSIWRDLM